MISIRQWRSRGFARQLFRPVLLPRSSTKSQALEWSNFAKQGIENLGTLLVFTRRWFLVGCGRVLTSQAHSTRPKIWTSSGSSMHQMLLLNQWTIVNALVQCPRHQRLFQKSLWLAPKQGSEMHDCKLPKGPEIQKEMFPFLASGMAHGLDATRRDLTSAWVSSHWHTHYCGQFPVRSKCLLQDSRMLLNVSTLLTLALCDFGPTLRACTRDNP